MKFRIRRPSPAMIVALLALFVALGGIGVAANGDNLILGQSNSATSPTMLTAPVAGGKALAVTNNSTTGGSTALALNVASGHSPFVVNSATKVPNLNADRLDGLDSTGFLRNLVPLSLTGSTATNGVISATNNGGANGVQGVASAFGVSGVYGQSNGAGYGVAGRANASGGVGVYAESTGGGPALAIHTSVGAPPMSVDSTAKVTNLNADQVDGLDPKSFVVSGDPGAGGRLLANRLASAVPGQVLLGIPGMGRLIVDTCYDPPSGASVARLTFTTDGTGPVDLMYYGIVANNGNNGGLADEIDAVIANSWPLPSPRVGGPTTWGAYTLNIARDTGLGTKMATVWVNWFAVGCRFQAQAIQSPQL